MALSVGTYLAYLSKKPPAEMLTGFIYASYLVHAVATFAKTLQDRDEADALEAPPS